MARYDLSLIVTAHDETVVAGPAMRAALASIAFAETQGVSIERIIVLDAATSQCRGFFNQSTFSDWIILETSVADLGLVRNQMVGIAEGAHIAFLDADDLFSENWLAEGLRAVQSATAQGKVAIAHPELNWFFDGTQSILASPAQDDPTFLPEYFYFANYYDSLCLAPIEAHLACPFVSRDIPNGLAFQDWQFAIETMQKGWQHVIAPDTIIFKRRRDTSLVTESFARKSIIRQTPAMAIGQARKLAG